METTTHLASKQELNGPRNLPDSAGVTIALGTPNPTGVAQRRPWPLGHFKTRVVKPIMPFLTTLYLRAQLIHQLARNVHVFHMQSIYIARQALHLVILLNDAVDANEGPSEEQDDGRNDLEDELIELSKAMTEWGSNKGDDSEYERQAVEIEQQYAQLFKGRSYFHDVRDCSTDPLYQRFVAYDAKTIRYRQRRETPINSPTTIEVNYSESLGPQGLLRPSLEDLMEERKAKGLTGRVTIWGKPDGGAAPKTLKRMFQDTLRATGLSRQRASDDQHALTPHTERLKDKDRDKPKPQDETKRNLKVTFTRNPKLSLLGGANDADDRPFMGPLRQASGSPPVLPLFSNPIISTNGSSANLGSTSVNGVTPVRPRAYGRRSSTSRDRDKGPTTPLLISKQRDLSPASPTSPTFSHRANKAARAVSPSPQQNQSPPPRITRFRSISTSNLPSSNVQRTVSPTYYSRNTSNTSLNASSPYHETIRIASSLLIKHLSKPPPPLRPEDWHDVEVRLRALSRWERIWGRSSGGGSSTTAVNSGSTFGGGEERERRLFCETVRDGYVLCALLNKFSPGTITRPDPKEDGLSKTSNVTKFLAGTLRYGISNADLFLRNDLLEATSESLGRVAQTIIALVKIGEPALPPSDGGRGIYMPTRNGAMSSPNLLKFRSRSPPSRPGPQERYSPPSALPRVPGSSSGKATTPTPNGTRQLRSYSISDKSNDFPHKAMQTSLASGPLPPRSPLRSPISTRVSVASTMTESTTGFSLLDNRTSVRSGTTEATSIHPSETSSIVGTRQDSKTGVTEPSGGEKSFWSHQTQFTDLPSTSKRRSYDRGASAARLAAAAAAHAAPLDVSPTRLRRERASSDLLSPDLSNVEEVDEMGNRRGRPFNRDSSLSVNAIRQPLIVREEGKPPMHYQIGNVIGRGQVGAVYRALNLNTGQMVAVKQIGLQDLSEDEISNLMKEVDVLKRLSHPSIVKYEGMVCSTDTLSIVLEYVENGSLSQTIKAFGKLNERLVASYVTKILEGLHYLHTSHVVHCDLKAANILTTKNGHVKLSDFGVSLNLHAKALEEIRNDVAGTPNWMAPEVIELKGPSTASDIWSLGCTTIELLTGHPPYHEIHNGLSVMFRIVEDPSPPIPEICSPLVEDFLKQCFKKNPKQRPSAEMLLEHPWLKAAWGEHKELRPQDSIPSLRHVSLELARSEGRSLDVDTRPAISLTDLPRESRELGNRTPASSSQPAPLTPLSPNSPDGLVRNHSFFKTTFSRAVLCRVCLQSVKLSAVLCEECGLIAHARCAADAPATCDIRTQLLLYSEYSQASFVQEVSTPTESTSSPAASAPIPIPGSPPTSPRKRRPSEATFSTSPKLSERLLGPWKRSNKSPEPASSPFAPASGPPRGRDANTDASRL